MNPSVQIFKALGDDNRLEILKALQKGELCACNLQEFLSISQSTLSHHMKLLTDCGLVSSRKAGKWIYYSLMETALENTLDLVHRSLKRDDDYVLNCACAEKET